MIVSKITVAGHDVNVIFTGMQYIFHNAYLGFLAVAERVDGREEETGVQVTRFILDVENYRTRGCSLNINTIIPAAKRYITKNENKYIHTVVEYDVRDAGDINALYYIEIVRYVPANKIVENSKVWDALDSARQQNESNK